MLQKLHSLWAQRNPKKSLSSLIKKYKLWVFYARKLTSLWDHRNPKRKRKKTEVDWAQSTKIHFFVLLEQTGLFAGHGFSQTKFCNPRRLLFLLNEYKALVCYICLSQSRQSPITTREKIHHLIGSGGGVLNPHAVLSSVWSGRQSFAYIFNMQVKASSFNLIVQ